VGHINIRDSFDSAQEVAACIKEAQEAFEKGSLNIPDGCTVKQVSGNALGVFQIDIDIVDYFDKFISDEQLKALCKKRGINVS
jgi:hypothetical protein